MGSWKDEKMGLGELKANYPNAKISLPTPIHPVFQLFLLFKLLAERVGFLQTLEVPDADAIENPF